MDDQLRAEEFVVKDGVVYLAGWSIQQLEQEPGGFFTLLIRKLLYGGDGSVVHVVADGLIGKADDADIVYRPFSVLYSVEGDIVVEGDDGIGFLFYRQELLQCLDGAFLRQVRRYHEGGVIFPSFPPERISEGVQSFLAGGQLCGSIDQGDAAMFFLNKEVDGLLHTRPQAAGDVMYVRHLRDTVQEDNGDIVPFQRFEVFVIDGVFCHGYEQAVHAMCLQGVN